MMTIKTAILLAIVCFTLAAAAAHAQVAPIKPGLWQIQLERDTDGQRATAISDSLKKLPPARRAEVEAMMKQRGVDINGNTMKVCETRETLDRASFANASTQCKTTYSTRTGSIWKAHSTCLQNQLEVDSEINFLNPENFTSKSVSVSKTGGQSRTSHMTRTGKWLSSDCGDIKPLSLEK